MRRLQKTERFVLSFILAVLICCVVSIQVQADEEQKRLSEMSEEECIAFLADMGVEIPTDFQDYEGIGEFVQETIVVVEENPNISFTYNYTGTLEFVNKIKKAVNEYYGISEQITFKVLVEPRSVALQYSTVASRWFPSFDSYNCYALQLLEKQKVHLIIPVIFRALR